VRAKILIVGGGVMGTSIAMNAARRTDPLADPVLLLERTELGAGSSRRSGAILRQFYSDRQLAGMARDSLREYAGFKTRTGYGIGFRRSGVLSIAGPDQHELVERNVEMMKGIGIEVELAGAERIRELVPGIEVGDESVAAWEQAAGFVDPGLTVDSFAALARFYGATTRCGREVTGIAVERGRVVGVETAEGAYEAEQVVLAAGPWMAGLLRGLGIDLPLRVLRPRQLFVEMLEPPAPSVEYEAAEGEQGPEAELERRLVPADHEPPVPHPVLLDIEHGSYCRCEPSEYRTRAGKMDYAGTPEIDGPEAFEDVVDDEFVAWTRERLEARVPAYHDHPEAGRLAAMYTITPDAQAILGPAPGVEGLFIAAGFSGHGFKLAPSIGLGITQMLFGEPVSAFDPAFFSPERFLARDVEWGGQFGL
jgi:glycine/D-amino acid oxidase-like deaminating enzyme